MGIRSELMSNARATVENSALSYKHFRFSICEDLQSPALGIKASSPKCPLSPQMVLVLMARTFALTRTTAEFVQTLAEFLLTPSILQSTYVNHGSTKS